MSYNSKYTGARVEELLDQIANGEVDNVYVTEFTIDELLLVVDSNIPLSIDKNSLVNAVKANKVIAIPYNTDNNGGGCIASVEDYGDVIYFYLKNYYSSIKFFVDTNETNAEITTDYIEVVWWQEALYSGENIKTINGEDIIGSGDLELATNDEVVHKEGDEVINGVKTFNGSVKFLDIGDDAITIGTDTRVRVDGTTATVLGLIRGTFFAGSPSYPLYLHGSLERPIYNVNDVELALLSDVDAKQDAIADLDTIRSGAEKGATALQSIPSEYVTESELTAKGYATTSALNDKVDKVSGKQLSTEDFTSALKAKLEGLSNYDDTALSNAISGLETRLNTLVSGDASTAIESFNEIMAFLDGIKDTQDLSSIIASIEQQIAGKYTKPSGGIPASDLAPDVFLQGEKGEKGDKGDKGDTGAIGPQGPQGVSVTSVAQTTTSSADGGSNVVTVTLSDGKTSTFTVKNGSKGSQGEKGDKGDTGATGANGTNGVSVSSVKQTTTSTADGGTNVVTVTLSNGTTSTFNVKNGSKGSNGTNGTNGTNGKDGANGATFTPSVDSAGNLSWTNNGGLTNPPTVNIKGPKGDSGEGGGSDSSVFITHFTVYEFASGFVEFTDEQVEAIRNAARQNKIIALPISSYDGYTGFLVSSYSYWEDEYGDWFLDLTIIYNGASYTNDISRQNPYFNRSRLTASPFQPFVEYTSVDEDGIAIADSTGKDNLIIIVEGECRFLYISECGLEYGTTIRFFTGEDCAIDYRGYWANGVIPTIEPYTAYEMSIVIGADYTPCAVLTPFKYVE